MNESPIQAKAIRGRRRKATSEKLVAVGTRVPLDVHLILQRIADARGLTVSDVIRRIVTAKMTVANLIEFR